MRVVSSKLSGLMRNQFVQNMGWMSCAEGVVRISRLVTAIALARVLSAAEYGMVAIVLMAHELLNVFTRSGIGQLVVRCPTERLTQTCLAVHRINWIVCILVFAVQGLLAWPIAAALGAADTAPLIAALGIVYLMYPLALVRVYLIQRDQAMQTLAAATSLQVGIDNLVTASAAVAGFGIWSIVIGKLCAAPVWVAYFLYKKHWSQTGEATRQDYLDVGRYALPVLLSESLKALRGNVDRIVISRVLGLDALGIYYFAINAGLGLSTALTQAFSTTLFPQLCKASTIGNHAFTATLDRTIRYGTIASMIVVSAQCVAAPFYVPVLFGQSWEVATGLLVLLCLSAIPRPMIEAVTQAFRVAGMPLAETIWHLLFGSVLGLGVLIGAGYNLLGVGIAVLCIHLLAAPVLMLVARRKLRRNVTTNPIRDLSVARI